MAAARPAVFSGAILAMRRGYSSAAATAATVMGRRPPPPPAAVAEKTGKRDVGAEYSKPPTPPSSSWVPDPVTGYYRPGNRRAEQDAAEMREVLLSRHHHTSS